MKALSLFLVVMVVVLAGCNGTPPPPDQVEGAGDTRKGGGEAPAEDVRAKQREAAESAPPLQPSGG